jgi:spore germination protein YaaH
LSAAAIFHARKLHHYVPEYLEHGKSYDSTKKLKYLPSGHEFHQRLGRRRELVRVRDLNPYCDTAAIMSYGMAWAGSAPGPSLQRTGLTASTTTPSQLMTPDKVFMGLPAYGWNWQIYDLPENLGKTYRGTSNTYYAAKNWMTGKYNFTDDAPPQPFIPILAYWDDYNKVPYAFRRSTTSWKVRTLQAMNIR